MAPPATTQKERVRGFWEAKPCGSAHAAAAPGTREFFHEVERKRGELEPFIGRYARFEDTAGRELLEIGVGLGTDFIRFVRAGANATGVDLTEAAVELVRRRVALEGLHAEVRTADAERLPFASESFDVVYSWGVLHHTPDTERAVAEAQRVLRPGGRLCVMLYGRRSWVAFGLWARYGLLRGRPWRTLSDVVANHMESDGTKAYTRRELEAMFGRLRDLRIEHVGTPYDARVAGPLARWTGRRLGWFVVISGTRTPSA
jgi:SAM-dependent methyltransferase